ncbi:hypothetical protein GXB78_07340 [Pseudomonas moraviensis subsp. stanleyae]|nr:hypothetical protein [Pseudomonas moraviensis]MED7667005.1 hypothetical protein [Pseudomonas moraviensis subsp. stanleyae]
MNIGSIARNDERISDLEKQKIGSLSQNDERIWDLEKHADRLPFPK